jgi:septal ring factor EnvC (AmiA/AmiB activator)
MGAVDDFTRESKISTSPLYNDYATMMDRDSAYEFFERMRLDQEELAQKELEERIRLKEEAEAAKQREKEEAAAAKEKERQERKMKSTANTIIGSATGTIGRQVGKTVGGALGGKFGKTLGGNVGASLGRGILKTLFKL